MIIKVYGTPNRYCKVRLLNPVVNKKRQKRLFLFDEHGTAIINTDEYRPRIVKAIMKTYKYTDLRERHESEPDKEIVVKEENNAEVKSGEEIKLRHCKKCDFACESQGDLLAHYRKEHKKEESE